MPSRAFPLEKSDPKTLRFYPGDIISCSIKPHHLASHLMLAVDEQSVIHVVGWLKLDLLFAVEF